MSQRSKTTLKGRISYRKRYAGWFIAAILFFLLLHQSFVIYLAISVIYGVPRTFGLIFFAFCSGSLTPITYFGLRTFGRTRTISEIIDSKTENAILYMIAIVAILLVTGNIFYHLLGFGGNIIAVIGLIIFLSFYAVAAISGWEFAATKMAMDNHDRRRLTSTYDDIPSEYKKALDVFQIKSDRNAFMVAFVTISSSIIIWYSVDFQTGLTAFVAIPGFIRTVLFLRPKSSD